MDIGPYPLFQEGYHRLGLKTRNIISTTASIIENVTENSCVIGTLYASVIGWHAVCITERHGNYVLVLNTDTLSLLHSRD